MGVVLGNRCPPLFLAEKIRPSGERGPEKLAKLNEYERTLGDRMAMQQMNAFETAQKAQLQMQEMGVKMGRAMLGGDKGK